MRAGSDEPDHDPLRRDAGPIAEYLATIASVAHTGRPFFVKFTEPFDEVVRWNRSQRRRNERLDLNVTQIATKSDQSRENERLSRYVESR